MGFGHVRRSHALATALKLKGFSIRVTLGSNAARNTELQFPADPGEPDLLLFDVPETQTEALRNAVRGPIPVIALDYFGDLSPTLTISVQERTPVPAGNRLHGFKYAIIRQEVRVLRGRCTSGAGVLIILGGADPRQFSGPVVDALDEWSEERTLVLGPYATSEVQERPGLRVVRDPPDLPLLMAQCRFAISSGGVTLTELLCLGKAVHVIPQSSAEEAFAETLDAAGALLGIGFDSIALPTTNIVKKTSTLGQALFDGDGVNRIGDVLRDVWRSHQK